MLVSALLSLSIEASWGQAEVASGPLAVTIAVGTERNYYPRFCQALHDVAQKAKTGIQVTCLQTPGSVDNVYSLQLGHADFAVIQSDVAHRVWNGEAPFAEDQAGPKVRLVSPLFTEKVHILVRPHQYLTSLSGLRRKRVWIGQENSGSRMSATNALLAAGLPDNLPVVDAMDTRQALALLGGTLHNGVQLDVAIDSLPTNLNALNGILVRLGIKSKELVLPESQERVALLYRPELSVNDLADLRDRTTWWDRSCPPKGTAILAAPGFAKPAGGTIREAVARLIRHEVDAIVEPASLDPELVSAIFDSGRYRLIPLAPDPRTNGKSKLLAIVRPDLSDLEFPLTALDKRIWWPEGNAALDQTVLQHILGQSASDDDRQKLMLGRRVGGSGAMKLLDLGELDAVFQTTVARNPIVADLMQDSEITLLGLDWPIVQRLEEDGSYVETSLQPNVYPQLRHGVYTVGVQTFLVTRLGIEKGEDQQKVAALARLLFEQQPAIEESITQHDPDYIAGNHSLAPFRLILLGSPLKGYLVKEDRIHPAGAGFLVKPGHLRRKTVNIIWMLGITIFMVGSTAIFLERKQWLARYHRTGVLVTLAAILFWALAAIWLQALEGDVTQDFSSLSGSAVSFAKTVASHFQLPLHPPAPTTRAGQNALDVFSWLGVFLVATFLLPLRAQISDLVAQLLGRKKNKDISEKETT